MKYLGSMSVGAIIDELGGTAKVAEELGKDQPLVSNWRARGRIPSDWWPALINLAKRSNTPGITFERLAAVQAPRTAAEARP